MKHIRSSFFVCLAVASLSLEGVAMADEDIQPFPGSAPTLPRGGPATAEPAPEPLPATLPPAAPAAPVALAPAPVAAAPVAGAPAPVAGDRDKAEDHSPNPVLQPWDVDARAALHTTPLFQYGGVGASADAGMRKIGPGTLALGGGLDYFFCGTTCASTPLDFTQSQLAVEGRVSYHLAPPKIGHLDVYPLVTAGFVMSRSSISVGDSSTYRASDVAPTIGFGGGASYFFADRFFVAAEARFRYAAGSYSYELASGPAKPFDRAGIDTWNASTVDLSGAVGARF